MDVLVLDVGYQPVSRVPWEHAIVWVLEKVVEVVDEYPDKYIRTVGWSVKMPSIVRFVKATPRKKAIKFSRHNVYSRDGGRCAYCSIRVDRDDFTYDHVLPRTQGGTTRWENVVVCCTPCNSKKGGRTPEQAGMHLRTKPVKPKKLAESRHFGMTYHEGMPESWKTFMSEVRDAVYWESALEED